MSGKGVHWTTQELAEVQRRQGAQAAPEVKLSGRAYAGLEKELQRKVEEYLCRRNYRRFCPPAFASLIGPHPEFFPTRGFWGHWFESQRNAFMPDLLIIAFPNVRPALFHELKVRNKYQPGQKAALGCGLWRVAFSLTEAKAIIETWEESN